MKCDLVNSADSNGPRILNLIAPVIGRRLSLWHVVLLSLVTATVPGCKQSKAPSDADMAGTYALSRNTPEIVSKEFDYVGRVSALELRPDHTFSVTNFPLIKGGGYWTPGELVSTNGQWMIRTRMQKDEWGMSQYAVHEIVFQIPGMDPIRGHISRWGAEVSFMANFSNRQGLISYKRAD